MDNHRLDLKLTLALEVEVLDSSTKEAKYKHKLAVATWFITLQTYKNAFYRGVRNERLNSSRLEVELAHKLDLMILHSPI